MYEKKFTLRHVIKNFSQMEMEKSPVEEHFGVPWLIKVEHEGEDFGVYLRCEREESKEKPWSVSVQYTFRTVSVAGNGQAEECSSMTFSSKSSWGFDFCKWSEMLEKYVVDDTLVLECEVTLKSITGIDQTRKLNFDDHKENLTDVVLKIEDRKFHVGKMLLATFSPYFKIMFYGSFTESKKSEIELKDVDPEDFQSFLEVIHGDPNIRGDNVESLLKLADRFQTRLVQDRCEDFLLFSTEVTGKNKIRIADAFGLENVKNNCLQNVKTMDDIRALLPADLNELNPPTAIALLQKAVSS